MTLLIDQILQLYNCTEKANIAISGCVGKLSVQCLVRDLLNASALKGNKSV